MTDFTDICDRLFVLEQQEKAIKKEITFIKDQLKENLAHNEKAFASNGYAYKISKTVKNNYDESAIDYIAGISVEALKVFASISDTSITKAKKAGLLCALDVASLEGMSHQTETVSVRQVVPDKSTVLPEKVGA
jgi:hypothetical protein